MATISSWILSFSASVRFNAFALFLQLLKCSNFFSSSHWVRCCFSIISLQPACFVWRLLKSSKNFLISVSDWATISQSFENSPILARNAFMASSDTAESPRCLARSAPSSEEVLSNILWYSLSFWRMTREMIKKITAAAAAAPQTGR